MEQKRRSGALIILNLAAFVIVVAGLKAAASLFVPLLLSIFIAIVSAPAIYWLKSKGIGQTVSLLLVVFLVSMTLIGIGTLVATSISDFSNSLSSYQQGLLEKIRSLVIWLNSKGLNFIKEDALVELLNPSSIIGLFGNFLSELGGMLTNALLIFFTVIFILIESAGFPQKIERAFGDQGKSLSQMEEVAKSVNRYMAIKTWISILTGFLAYILCAFVGVKYAMLWGLIAFLLNFIPTFGSIIAAVPVVLISLLQHSIVDTVVLLVGYIVINTIIGNVIEPKVMGKGLGLSSLVVFISLVFWGWVLGPVGMLLSIPLTMTIKIALDSNPDAKWISVLLGE